MDGRNAHAQAQPAQLTLAGSARNIKCNINVSDDSATVLVEHGPGRSKGNPAPIAEQQRSTNLLLKIPDSLA